MSVPEKKPANADRIDELNQGYPEALDYLNPNIAEDMISAGYELGQEKIVQSEEPVSFFDEFTEALKSYKSRFPDQHGRDTSVFLFGLVAGISDRKQKEIIR